jgi:hypothetical protein
MGRPVPLLLLTLSACATASETAADREADLRLRQIDQACTPTVVFDNRDAEGDGKLFQDTLGDAVSTVQRASRTICRLLYTDPAEVPSRPTVKLVVEKKRGIAYTSKHEVHASSEYFARYRKGSLRYEILGVLHHELTHVWQSGGKSWVIEGIADYVRYRSNFFPITNRHLGGKYDASYQTTGFFFDWLETQQPGFVHHLNQRLKTDRFSETWFAELTGKDAPTLWSEYQAAITPVASTNQSGPSEVSGLGVVGSQPLKH